VRVARAARAGDQLVRVLDPAVVRRLELVAFVPDHVLDTQAGAVEHRAHALVEPFRDDVRVRTSDDRLVGNVAGWRPEDVLEGWELGRHGVVLVRNDAELEAPSAWDGAIHEHVHDTCQHVLCRFVSRTEVRRGANHMSHPFARPIDSLSRMGTN
jgi:hypothetical protein